MYVIEMMSKNRGSTAHFYSVLYTRMRRVYRLAFERAYLLMNMIYMLTKFYTCTVERYTCTVEEFPKSSIRILRPALELAAFIAANAIFK